MSTARRQLSVETTVLFALGAIFVGLGGVMCVSAYRAAGSGPIVAAETQPFRAPMLPQALPDNGSSSPVFLPPPTILPPPPVVEAYAPDNDEPIQRRPSVIAEPEPPIAVGPSTPFPPVRPIELNVATLPSLKLDAGHGPDAVDLGLKPASLGDYDHFTAVYDLKAHTVYLPDGGRLEAHSGLGGLRDDPSHVDIADRGATPPHVYDLTLREDLFHGVQALRLNPVGGPNSIYGRVGLLAHTYMLGPAGDSNGCVSFKNYDAFLQAFQAGHIKRLAVVAALR